MTFVFDLDGTICFSGREISPKIVSELEKLESRGHELVFASARPIRDMLPLIRGVFDHSFLIGGNGSIISDKGKVKVMSSIEEEDFSQLQRIIEKYDLDYILDSDWDYALKNRNDELANINSKVDALKLAQNILPSAIKTCIKCHLLNIPSEHYEKIVNLLDRMNVTKIVHSDAQSVDIVATGINKYETFVSIFGSEEYVAFGNDHNDIELLSNAKYAVSVGDNESVKKISHVNLEATDEALADFLATYEI